MAKKVRAAIYARVSTDDKGQDPETQLGLLRDYCQRRGWDFKEYVDYASGSNMNRESLNQLQHDIAWLRVNTVIIYKLDRLARNLRELLEIGDDWGKRGVDLISLTESVDTTSLQGRLVFQILGAVAEFERNLIIERVNAGLARARREGKRLGRPKRRVSIPPYIVEAIKNGELSLYGAAKQTGIPRSTLKRRLEVKSAERPAEMVSVGNTAIVHTKLVGTARVMATPTEGYDQNG
jgi:DNA invertase Pin-like site-specific DNA recombinase